MSAAPQRINDLPQPSPVEAARHICQEARLVLTSLRGGPPHIARGELAQDLMELRDRVPLDFDPPLSSSSSSSSPDSAPLQQLRASVDYSRPFLQVVTDPRASGPHTRVALGALERLLRNNAFSLCGEHMHYQSLLQGVLACKFEQTNASQDEAVEMAIADVLALILQHWLPLLQPETVHEAFHTVFVTRNTFVHSAALSYHLEAVLQRMVTTIFSHPAGTLPRQSHLPPHPVSPTVDEATMPLTTPSPSSHDGPESAAGVLVEPGPAVRVLDFVVHQLLHTPLLAGDGMDESTRERQAAHDATRVLCLQLVRTALEAVLATVETTTNPPAAGVIDILEPLLPVIQDDLCLSLLMMGQAIWAYHEDVDPRQASPPGYVSLAVLSQICATLSLLWNSPALRPHIIGPFEPIWTGFYTRALVLLRQRREATHASSYQANLLFDAELEVILESLVDLLNLHEQNQSIIADHGAALESMFVYYDCHLQRHDVAVGIYVELCRACGGTVNEEGQVVAVAAAGGSPSGGGPNAASGSDSNLNLDFMDASTASGGTPTTNAATSATNSAPPVDDDMSAGTQNMVRVDHPWRPVPAHLKELCATAIMGGMKCLFRDDKPSAETVRERNLRSTSILSGSGADPHTLEGKTDAVKTSSHVLRDIKSQKRIMRRAARIFNKKDSRGIEFLVDCGMLPDPVTPLSVAQFLRHAIVVGLDKAAVGSYLGEAGKTSESAAPWQRDWFHKECLTAYCSLFKFQEQSVLDSLRMFLAAFRLPGEAQQIDRILQAFADQVASGCAEADTLFSKDPKRASDAAYLLSFSIIMLNTDQHNSNIRADRKMSVDDFVKNNTDYGREITEPGKAFPREYLVGIYESIKEEEIRTEGEGAAGAMTVERWKDVLRQAAAEGTGIHPNVHDAEDLTELILEHVWKPILSAIAAFWNVYGRDEYGNHSVPQNVMIGVQGARLGMDMSLEMLHGVRHLGRLDIFRKIFSWICDYTGLLSPVALTAEEWMQSAEAQAAFMVAVRTALEAGEDLEGPDGWKRMWGLLLELRDWQVLPSNFLRESENDLLSPEARSEWNEAMKLGDMSPDSTKKVVAPKSSSVLQAFGRAIFGREVSDEVDTEKDNTRLVWDEVGPVEDEGEGQNQMFSLEEELGADLTYLSAGAILEAQLVRETMEEKEGYDTPVTGLERAQEDGPISQRARLRRRFQQSCNLTGLVADSRFLNDAGVQNALLALMDLIRSLDIADSNAASLPPVTPVRLPVERSESDVSVSTPSFVANIHWNIPLSPASEAFSEVLICEIALKNRDRLKMLWSSVLRDHYVARLRLTSEANPNDQLRKIPPNPGFEKRVTGLLRLSICSMLRDDVRNDILSSWREVLGSGVDEEPRPSMRTLHRHLSAGLWRIVSIVDGVSRLDNDGWLSLMPLFNWCSRQSCNLQAMTDRKTTLAEDDTALQTYRSIHLLLNTSDLDASKFPVDLVDCIGYLVAAGDSRGYPQLCIASLDMLQLLSERKGSSIKAGDHEAMEKYCSTCWSSVVSAMAEAAERSRFANVRQHALSMLTDLFVSKRDDGLPVQHMSKALSTVCVPLAGRCISNLKSGGGARSSKDELMIEFELCIGLIFKPLRFHLGALLTTRECLIPVWEAVLLAIQEMLSSNSSGDFVSEEQHSSLRDLASGHLQNAVTVLVTSNILKLGNNADELSENTWEALHHMKFSQQDITSWLEKAQYNSS